MCGIVAVVARKGQQVPLEMVEKAATALRHRGPDDDGVYAGGEVAFGFRRLSILDLSPAGHQPMTSLDGSMTIVFNGEIYNYVELRTELIALGHRFRSKGDTEVLLAAYQQWGPDCVRRFNGMWAFLIHDRRTNVVFGSRDRLGVKPLYVWENGDWLIFASEPRAIAATGLASLQPNMPRLAESLVWGQMDHDHGTCLTGVRHVPAGSRFFLSPREPRLSFEAFWTLPNDQRGDHDLPEQDWINSLQQLIGDAVRIRQRSDVPVGFTLSGGIDSTILICEAARSSTRGELLAFAYQDGAFNEQQQIRDTVSQTGARLVSISEHDLDLATMLPAVIRANGEPVHSMTAVANYALFQLAARHNVKVVIGGQGADESFVGYTSYEENLWYSLLNSFEIRALLGDIVASSRLSQRSALAQVFRMLLRAGRIAVADTSVYGWARARLARKLPDNPWNELFCDGFLSAAGAREKTRADYLLEREQRRSLQRWPLPMYLRIEDRCSMAHSVEARLPFTDYRLIDLALRMPRKLKYAHGLNKVALRKAATDRVPPSVSSRTSKLGFPVSSSAKAVSDLRSLCGDLVGSRAFAERGIYNIRNARALLARDSPASQRFESMFRLAQTELWLLDTTHDACAASHGKHRA
jgi:asparagine synthase (glutamine-hydrolysing)